MEAQNNFNNGQTTAIVTYITIIGWQIAYFADAFLFGLIS